MSNVIGHLKKFKKLNKRKDKKELYKLIRKMMSFQIRGGKTIQMKESLK